MHCSARVLFTALAAVVLCGCRGEAPAWADGVREGGALSPREKARFHYDTRVRPRSSGTSTALDPQVVDTDEGRLRKIVTYTRIYDVDGFYGAMVGPTSSLAIALPGDPAEPELLWIKGISVEVVDADGELLSQEYTCHMVASIADTKSHDAALGVTSEDSRFTALAQGLYHKEYPRGFGLPALSSDELGFNSQVLNYNTPIGPAPLRIRHRIVTLFMRDGDAKLPMKAITNTFAQASVLLNGEEGDGYFGVRVPDTRAHGESCAVGVKADSRAPVMEDAFGRRFAPHWIVDPGPSTNHSLVTQIMNIRYDTTLHTIDVHLHPFGEWVELRDLTAGEVVFRASARQLGGGIGLADVQSYSSEKGLPVYADHEYALVSAYDNTSGEPQDAMAILYLGLHDRDFDAAALRDPALRAARQWESHAAEIERQRRAVEADPEDPAARFALGRALFIGGQFARAEEQFVRATQLDPDNPHARGALHQTRTRLAERDPPGPADPGR